MQCHCLWLPKIATAPLHMVPSGARALGCLYGAGHTNVSLPPLRQRAGAVEEGGRLGREPCELRRLLPNRHAACAVPVSSSIGYFAVARPLGCPYWARQNRSSGTGLAVEAAQRRSRYPTPLGVLPAHAGVGRADCKQHPNMGQSARG